MVRFTAAALTFAAGRGQLGGEGDRHGRTPRSEPLPFALNAKPSTLTPRATSSAIPCSAPPRTDVSFCRNQWCSCQGFFLYHPPYLFAVRCGVVTSPRWAWHQALLVSAAVAGRLHAGRLCSDWASGWPQVRNPSMFRRAVPLRR
eukprot:3933012-Rhodomonas_salina.4